MKFNIKLLAAAVTLALSSVAAHAGIDTSTNPSLVLFVWDSTGTVSNNYARVIGNVDQLGTANLTFNAPAASIFSTQLGAVSAANLGWEVVALDNVNPVVYGTLNMSNLITQRLDNFAVTGIADILTNSLGGFTQLDLAANGYAKANGEYTGAANLDDQTHGATLNRTFGFGTFNIGYGVGSRENFVKVDQDGAVSQIDVNADLLSINGTSKGGYFTLGANGSLTWTGSAAAAATPLPAAALLFAPGLLALVGARRRKNAA